MSERLPNTSSAHAVPRCSPRLADGHLEARRDVFGLTPVVVCGSLGPKLPFHAFEAKHLKRSQTSAPGLTLSPRVCPPSVGKIVGVSVLHLVFTAFMRQLVFPVEE